MGRRSRLVAAHVDAIATVLNVRVLAIVVIEQDLTVAIIAPDPQMAGVKRLFGMIDWGKLDEQVRLTE